MSYPNLPTPPEWISAAPCAQTDPEAFFPHPLARGTEARAICARCNVQAQCLAYALADPTLTGIWGNTNDRERRKLRKEVNSGA